jgi:hypothetical protein
MFEQIALEFGLSATWNSEVADWGKRVALYRRYAAGDHRANLTARMKAMLHVSDETEFNINYCGAIVQTMADRLKLAGVDADGDNQEAIAEWIDNLLWYNAMPSLQMDVHEAVIRDGDTFIMVAYDNDKQVATMTHELAWDGSTGVVPIYDLTNTVMIGAVKVWWENRAVVGADGMASVQLEQRANVYEANRVRKYWLSSWMLIEDVEWLPGELPIVHYRNNGRSRYWRGMSEIDNVLGLQDSLNRTLVSMTMTGELAAFPVNVAIGFTPNESVEPGITIVATRRNESGNDIGLTRDDYVDMKQLPASSLVPYIEQSHFIVEQMSQITRTPLAKTGGDTASGESLKQKEIGLIAKVEKAQIRLGESWSWAVELAHMVTMAYGKNATPKIGRVTARWEGAEIRNDSEVVKNALAVRDAIGDEAFIKLIAPVFGWDNEAVQGILEGKVAQQMTLLRGVNGFGMGGGVDPSVSQ